MRPRQSLLPIVERADNFPYPPSLASSSNALSTTSSGKKDVEHEHIIPFHLTFPDYLNNLPPVGLLRPQVVQVLSTESQAEENAEDAGSTSRSPWQFYHSTRLLVDPEADDEFLGVDEDGDLGTLVLSPQCVFLSDWVLEGGSDTIGKVMNETVKRWRNEGKFAKPLGGWRNEQYSVYGSPHSSFFSMHNIDLSGSFANKAFPLERSACAIFGLPTFGVHMTGYEGEGESMKIWVPKRASTKATFPSMLDQTVAGGIPYLLTPLESMIKECEEEASLSPSFVKPRLCNVGISTYFYIADGGWLQPEIEYLYDLKVPQVGEDGFDGMRPGDDEVDSFKLMTVSEVMTALHAGSFKPNCALILVDFLIRHGLVTSENEPKYIEIAWRLRRRLEIAMPL